MIKFLDLQKINAQYADELKKAASDVIDSGWFLMGEKLNSFESKLANYIGAKHAIGVANGLDALRLILKAYIDMGIMNEGDEVIVPANTYIASVLAITDNRLKPILVEPKDSSFNLDIDLIEGLDDYIRIHTKPRPVLTLMTLKSLQEKLHPKEFLRIHRSYIVPISKIESFGKNKVRVAGRDIPIGSSYTEVYQQLLKTKNLQP